MPRFAGLSELCAEMASGVFEVNCDADRHAVLRSVLEFDNVEKPEVNKSLIPASSQVNAPS